LRNVIPKPRQKPHPPLWVACSQMDTIRMAGQRGLGALGFSFVSAESAQAWCHAYYNEFVHRQERLCDYQPNANLAVVSPFMCCETDEEAQAKMDGWSFFQFALILYNKEGPFEPGTVNLWDRYQEWKRSGEGKDLTTNAGLVGSPDTIRKRLKQFQEVHIDQVILLNQAGKNKHEDICSSLELFAEELLPEFHAEEAAHAQWKEAVLSGELELEDIDTNQYNIYSLQTPTKEAS
ncbi:MAG: LLM class flavin-dependent oxidoreductase, partial [Gammaproteobacteria bacterium]|nr:LLM class flavin-dependent oxidoreductase [Gammaproteobacteria bacterium]